MSLDKAAKPKKPSNTFEIDNDDINEGFEKIANAERKGRSELSRDYFHPDDSISPSQERTPSEAAAREDYERIQRSLERLGIRLHDKRVLEIGSGMGELLSVLRKEGVDAVGVDMNPRDYSRPYEDRLETDMQVIHAPLEALKAEKIGTFGVIIARDVFDDDRYKFQVYKNMLNDIDGLLAQNDVFVKIGTGRFTEDDVPTNWKLVVGDQYEFGIFQKQ